MRLMQRTFSCNLKIKEIVDPIAIFFRRKSFYVDMDVKANVARFFVRRKKGFLTETIRILVERNNGIMEI